jgi:PfaB family protein
MNLAITGLDVMLPGCESLELFETDVYQGLRFSGEIPVEFQNLQGLLSRIIFGVMENAGFDVTNIRSNRIALIFIHGNFPVQNQISQNSERQTCSDPIKDETIKLLENLKLGGPIIALREQAGTLARGIVKASDILNAKKADAVIVASLSGWLGGKDWAAGAVLVESQEAILESGHRVFATIKAAAAYTPETESAGTGNTRMVSSEIDVTRWCQRIFINAGISPSEIGYLEVWHQVKPVFSLEETRGCVTAYQSEEAGLYCGIGSIQVNTPQVNAVIEICSLIRSTFTVYHRFIPATSGWLNYKELDLWQQSPFFVTEEPRPWFVQDPQTLRHAGMIHFGDGGSISHFILCEGSSPDAINLINPGSKTAVENFFKDTRTRKNLTVMGTFLIPITGNTIEEILQKAASLKSSIQATNNLSSFSNQMVQEYELAQNAPLAISFVCHDEQELIREISFALKSLPAAFEKGMDWQTPAGSFFSSRPLGYGTKIAFVYPGAFNSYPGFGRDLLFLYPQFYDQLVELVGDIGGAIQEQLLYPRSPVPISKTQLDSIEARLNSNPIAMMTSGMSMAIIYTLILHEAYGIQNQAAFGYSLGENSMMIASGVMSHGIEGKKQLEESPLFHTRLAGPKNAVREYWGMSPVGADTVDEDLWANYILMTTPEAVVELLDGEEHVFLTHINTPRQVSIAGDRNSCERVIETLHCNALRAPFDYVLHCPAMQSEYPALVDLHSWPVKPVSGVQLYSSADNNVFQIEREAIARKLAKGLCNTVDFPGLTERVYLDGARFFIELGAGSNCTRWIDETLKNQPHCAVSINRRGIDDFNSILRVLARLCSHRLTVDLSSLYRSANK